METHTQGPKPSVRKSRPRIEGISLKDGTWGGERGYEDYVIILEHNYDEFID
jgi:hypothetical protein